MSDTESKQTKKPVGGAKVADPSKADNVAAADDAGATPLVYGAVNRVAVRLPPFWPDDPEVWFAQVEAQFEVTGTKTDSTKFYTVVQQLDQNAAREVRDIIMDPPVPKGDELRYIIYSCNESL